MRRLEKKEKEVFYGEGGDVRWQVMGIKEIETSSSLEATFFLYETEYGFLSLDAGIERVYIREWGTCGE